MVRVCLCVVIVAGCGSDGEVAGNSDSAQTVATAASAVQVAAAPEPTPPAYRPIMSLFDNRALAHWVRGRDVLILAGGGGKYVWPGKGARRWPRPVVRDGEVATIPGMQARFDIPLTSAQAAHTRVVSLRVHARRRSAVTIGFNERDRRRRVRRVVSLVRGWQVVSAALPAKSALAGTNALRLRFRDSGAAVSWIQVGEASAGGAAPMVHDLAERALVVDRGMSVSYYLWIPDGASLSANVADGCVVSVSAASAAHELAGELGGERARLSLAALAGTVARVTLRSGTCQRAVVRDATLVVPGTPPRVVRGAPPRNVVLWVMDTLRADRVRAIDRDARAETPVMEALAKTGTVFRSFYVEGNESQTSHSSLFTSVYPAVHRVLTAGPVENYRLSPRFDAIAPLLRDAGFQTLGVTANGNVHSWTGYRRGFDAFNNVMRDGTGRRNGGYVSGDIVYRRVVGKLATIDVAEPFFLFIGTVDTHKPWVAHEPWLSKYDPQQYRGRYKTRADGASLAVIPGTHICTARLSKRDKARILALYDSNVSFQDQLLGKFLHHLETLGIRDETMIIVTADHGEELWEHPPHCGHGSSLRESLVRVPLLVHYPPMFPGRVVEVGADGVDVLPTILDVLRMSPTPQVQGESLVPVAHGHGADYPRPAYATMNEMAHTMRLGPYKMWVGMAGNPALYDVVEDPDERKNLLLARPRVARFLRDALVTFLGQRHRWKKTTWGVASNMTAVGARALGPTDAE